MYEHFPDELLVHISKFMKPKEVVTKLRLLNKRTEKLTRSYVVEKNMIQARLQKFEIKVRGLISKEKTKEDAEDVIAEGALLFMHALDKEFFALSIKIEYLLIAAEKISEKKPS